MPKVRKFLTTVYDVEHDADFEVSLLEHIEDEEVLAYVPEGSPYRNQVIQAIVDCVDSIDNAAADSLADTVPVPNTH